MSAKYKIFQLAVNFSLLFLCAEKSNSSVVEIFSCHSIHYPLNATFNRREYFLRPCKKTARGAAVIYYRTIVSSSHPAHISNALVLGLLLSNNVLVDIYHCNIPVVNVCRFIPSSLNYSWWIMSKQNWRNWKWMIFLQNFAE